MKYLLSGTLEGHELDVRGIDTPFDGMIVSCLRDGTVRMWNHPEATSWDKSAKVDSSVIFTSPTASFVNSIAFIPEETEPAIANGGQDSVIYVSEPYQNDSLQDSKLRELYGHQGNVCSLHYKDSMLISGSWDSTAKVWDLTNCEVIYDLKGHQATVWDAKVIDPNTFLTCSADRSIKLWDGDKAIRTYSGHEDVVRKLLVLPGGDQFVSCSNDGTLKVWDLRSGQVIQTLVGHESFVYDVCLLPNGDLVSSGEDRSVRIWRDGVTIQSIILPAISLWSVSSLPNGDFVVGGSDKLLRVFSAEKTRQASEEEIMQLKKEVEMSQISELSMDDLKKTDIPGYDALENPGKQEGSVIMVKNPSGVIEAHQWSGGEWVKIGDVVGSNLGEKHDFNGQTWDYLFDVDVADGAPPLKLPYNSNENVYVAADRFLAANELPNSYRDQVVEFIEKNTEGVKLDQAQAPVENPYADKPKGVPANLNVLPITNYIRYQEYKESQLIKGLEKINLDQVNLKLDEEELSFVSYALSDLNSKQALKLITSTIKIITEEWPQELQLIAYDMLRISVCRVTTVDLLSTTDIAAIVLDIVKSGLKTESITLFMMTLKIMSNLVDNTLFIQLFIEPNDEGKYELNEFFIEILDLIRSLISKFSAQLESKHYATTMAAAATLYFNLSAFYLKTSLLNTNRGSAIPLVSLALKLGEIIIQASSEAAYRMLVALGNLSQVGQLELPAWVNAVKYDEPRFATLFKDINQLKH